MPSPFHRNILLIDIETSSRNQEVGEPIELGAVLLDRKTLKERKSFQSYIRASLENAEPASLRLAGVRPATIRRAPTIAAVGRLLLKQFGYAPTLCSWVENVDRPMIERIVTAGGGNFQRFDYHYIDLWAAAYIHLLQRGYAGSITSEAMFRAFGQPKRTHHHALEDCRKEAEVLRIIMRSPVAIQ